VNSLSHEADKYSNVTFFMVLLRGGPNLSDIGRAHSTPVVRNDLEVCIGFDGSSAMSCCVACALNL